MLGCLLDRDLAGGDGLLDDAVEQPLRLGDLGSDLVAPSSSSASAIAGGSVPWSAWWAGTPQ